MTGMTVAATNLGPPSTLLPAVTGTRTVGGAPYLNPLPWGCLERPHKYSRGRPNTLPDSMFFRSIALGAVFCGGVISGAGAACLRIRHQVTALSLTGPGHEAAAGSDPAGIRPLPESPTLAKAQAYRWQRDW
jgi:hypothetical protein